MKCIKCGFEAQEDFNFCPVCSQQQTPVEPVSINPAADKVMSALKDGMFLTICVLMSLYCAMSILAGTFPLIQILATIFLWITYAQSTKGFVSAEHIRGVSGAVYAGYVLNNILFVMFAIGGVLIGAVLSLLSGTQELNDMLIELLAELELSASDITKIQDVLEMGGWVLGAAFIFIAVIGLLINILGMRKIHRFTKSVYQSVMYNAPNFKNPKGTKNWLMFFGVCTAITASSLFLSGAYIFAVANASIAIAQIMASVLIKKYFVEKSQYIG